MARAQVEGVNVLLAKLRAIAPKVDAALRKALEKSAQEIVDLARRLAPVDSGNLRDSIGWTWGDAPAGSVSIGTVKGSARSRLAITIYAGNREKNGAFYAAWQEFGTQNMAANPFFFPAYRALKGRAKGRITRAVRKAVKDAR